MSLEIREILFSKDASTLVILCPGRVLVVQRDTFPVCHMCKVVLGTETRQSVIGHKTCCILLVLYLQKS